MTKLLKCIILSNCVNFAFGDLDLDSVNLLQTGVRQHQQMQGTIGHFSEFYEAFDKPVVCHTHGTFHSPEGTRVSFMASHTNVTLAIAGVPKLSLTYSSLPNQAVTWVEFGDHSFAPDLTQPGEVKDELAQLFSSPFAFGGAKALSSQLGRRSWNGADRECSGKLHMLLLNLEKAAANPSWGPYGSSDRCPANKAADWKCEASSFSGTGTYYTPGDPHLSAANISWYQDVKCKPNPGSSNQDCTGLCGKGCDCWESICGDKYKCEYHPVCCAHDEACRRDGFLSSKCMNIFVEHSCSDAEVGKYVKN